MLSPAGDPAVLSTDGERAADGAGRSQLLDRCWTPQPVPLSRLIAIAAVRWRIEEDHQLAKQATGLDAGQVIRWRSWHRWTAICLLAYIYLAAAVQRQQDTSFGLDAGLIPLTVSELLRLLRDAVIPPPGATGPIGSTGRRGDATTSTAPVKPPTLEHLRRDDTMITTNYSCRS